MVGLGTSEVEGPVVAEDTYVSPGWVFTTVEGGLIGSGELANPQESKETEKKGSLQHRLVMRIERASSLEYG